MFNDEAHTNLESAKELVPNSLMRIAKTGTPHLVIQGSDETYSLYYYNRTKNYRLFWPWPSYDAKQHQKNFKTPFEVRDYLSKR